MTYVATAAVPTRPLHEGGDGHTFVTGNRPSPARLLLMAASALVFANVVAVVFSGHPAVQLGVVAALLWLPGRLVMRSAGYVAASAAAGVVVTIALSVTVLMLAGLAANTVGSLLGVAHPLARPSLLVAINVCLAGLLIAALRRPGPPLLSWPSGRTVTALAAGAVLPVLAVCGALRLDNAQPNHVAVIAALAVGAVLVAGLLRADRWGDAVSTGILSSAAIALTLSFSMRGAYLFGFDIQQEFGTFLGTQASGLWTPGHTGAADDAYRAMLSITVLPQMLVQLAGVGALDVFRIVLPLLVAGVPVAIFALARQRAGMRVSFGVAAIPVLLPQLSSQLPAVTRQAVALLIFGALLVVVFEPAARAGRTLVAVVLCTGLAVSHYSTAYVAVFVLACTWLVTTLLRLPRRHRWQHRRAASAVIVGWLVLSCLVWNLVITDSGTNLRQFASATTGSGVQVLPANSRDAGLLDRWLNAPVPAPVSGPQFSDLVAAQYRTQHPWMDHYTPAEVAAAPLQSDRVPDLQGRLPLKPVFDLATAAANQLLLLSIVVSALMLFWAHRRRRDVDLELTLAVLSALALTGFGRISGPALASYNADRLYLQSLMLFAVALAFGATVIGTKRAAIRRTGQVLVTGLFLVLYLSTTQVAAPLIGGSPTPNLSNTGEAAERYLYTATDVEMAVWLDRQAPPESLIFVDRYMVLAMWNTTNRSGQVYTSVAPSALDPRGYVMLNNVNITEGRARGLVGRSMGVFRTPTGFLQDHKNVIYSTANSRIYR